MRSFSLPLHLYHCLSFTHSLTWIQIHRGYEAFSRVMRLAHTADSSATAMVRTQLKRFLDEAVVTDTEGWIRYPSLASSLQLDKISPSRLVTSWVAPGNLRQRRHFLLRTEGGSEVPNEVLSPSPSFLSSGLSAHVRHESQESVQVVYLFHSFLYMSSALFSP